MSAPKPLLVVTGTKREAQTIAGPGVLTVAGGGNRARLMEALDRLAPQSCGVLSYGMAGALSPDLRLGEWIVGTGVTGEWQGDCDGAFGIALAQRLRTGRRLPPQGLVHASDALIATADEKAELHAMTGAIAADMESHLAGEAAARHGLRFAVLRCISDEAAACLPPAVAVAMKPGGGLAPGAIVWSLLTRPGQIPALVRTTRKFNRAFTVLAAGGPRVLHN
ncbi:MAG: phosphorylase [Sphingomonadales bacterium]|nr:phosphorylase [Sphingomonadales bacterium]